MMTTPLKIGVDIVYLPETGARSVLIAHDRLLLLSADDHKGQCIVVMMIKVRDSITVRLTREMFLHHVKSHLDKEINRRHHLINVSAHLLLQYKHSHASSVKIETVQDEVINSSNGVILHLLVPLHLHPPHLPLILLHQEVKGKSLVYLIDDLLPDLVLKKKKKQLVHRWFGSVTRAAVVHLLHILPLHLLERDKERALVLLLHVLHLLFRHLQLEGGNMKRDTIKDNQNLIR